ncbi:MAG: hypothetical protein V1777_04785 [Candidatus Micrarchaeota archaeon]
MNKGFWLTLDAVLGILLVSGLLLMFASFPAESFSQTIVLQKEFDLFKVWDQTRPTTEEMRQDIERLFSSQDYELQINHQTVLAKNTGSFGNTVSAEGIFFQNNWTSIRLTVYR